MSDALTPPKQDMSRQRFVDSSLTPTGTVRTDVRLGFGRKLAFAMGDTYAGGFFNLVGFFYAIFLTDIVGINPAWAGLIFAVSKIVDAFVDPLVGALSDRTRSRWGRRRPYFLFGAPLVILSTIWLWYPVSAGDEVEKAILCFAAFVVANIVASLVQVPFLAMSAELSTDYRERNSVTSVRMTVSLLSGLVCAVLPPVIVGAFTEVRTGWFIMGVVFGAWFGLPLLITFWKSREPTAFHRRADADQGVFRPMLQTLTVRSFRRLNYIYLGIFTTGDLVSMMMAYYMTYILERPGELSTVLGTLLVCEIAAIPLATRFANRTSKTTAIIVGSTGWILLGASILMLSRATPGFVIYILCAAIGFCFAFALVGVIAMFGDVADVGELYFDRRMEGAFAGTQQFIRKCASAGANALALGLLATSGYVAAGGGEQPPAVFLTIQLVMGLTAAVLLLPTIYLCMRWRLTPDVHARLIRYLDRRRSHRPINETEENEMQHLRRSVL